VADRADALRRVREIANDGVATRVLAFDSSVVALGSDASVFDSLARVSGIDGRVMGSLSVALAAARRIGAEIGAGADSVELVLVSPLTEQEVDAATAKIRATWPGAVRVVRVSAVADSAPVPALERAVSDVDVLGPALGARDVRASSNAVRIVRREPSAEDRAFARGGGVVVRWDSLGSRAGVPSAVAMGDDVIVATLGRATLPQSGIVLARWNDGAPAAVEHVVGTGCLREVGIGVPVAGDLPLSLSFQRIVNGLTGNCVGARAIAGAPLDSARVTLRMGPTQLAAGSALANGAERPTPIAPWLLGVALACALAVLLLRRRVQLEPA
jgi:hypothetical protein